MSIPIYPAPVEQATGIVCPPIIFLTLYTAKSIPSIMQHGCVITEVTPEHIYFKLAKPGKIKLEKSQGGHYQYDFNWETYPVIRSTLSINKLDLFNLIVLNTKHWGKAAELSLEFIAKTLE